jgi:hypothetical protein
MGGISSYMDFPGVLISGDMTFTEQARAALLKLNGKARGKTLLKEIVVWLSQKNSHITIEVADGFDGQNGSGWDGGAKVMRWSPAGRIAESADPDQLNGIPPFIILGHELCHCLHTLQGTDSYGYAKFDDIAIEEARTIGLGPWATDGLSENGLREEWKYKLRTTFQDADAGRLLQRTKYAV